MTHHVPPFVTISEGELALLRQQLVDRRCLDVQYSANELRLENTPVNHWAFPLLASKRGLSD